MSDIQTVNPATGQPISEYSHYTREEIAAHAAAANSAFGTWRKTDLATRASRLQKMAELLESEQETLAVQMTGEMGKPVSQARGEIDKCAWVCRYYAEQGPTFLEPAVIETDASRSYVRYDPLGPLLAIMPWNFPFWQVFRAAAPAMMLGNPVLLKHSQNVTGCALEIEALFGRAEFPEGMFSTLLMPTSDVADLIGRPEVRAVTLTGSGRAGKSVAEAAGTHLKKMVLELGGSDPFIVLDDVEIEQVAQSAVKARILNTGQSCIAAKRFIVMESVAEKFEAAMVAQMEALTVGDPTDEDSDLGPMARLDLLEDLHDQVTRSVNAGARLRTGGRRLDRAGFFYPPTVLSGVQPGMAAADEETFGPVAAIMTVTSEQHALQLANQSAFGLGASIWTSTPQRAEKLAEDVQAGCVFINQLVHSDPRLPFGGVKESGYGRELSTIGLQEFANQKTVSVK